MSTSIAPKAGSAVSGPPCTGRGPVKKALSLLLAAGLGAYLVTGIEHLRIGEGYTLLFRTGDYQWRYPLDAVFCLQMLGAGVLAAILIRGPGKIPGESRGWGLHNLVLFLITLYVWLFVVRLLDLQKVAWADRLVLTSPVFLLAGALWYKLPRWNPSHLRQAVAALSRGAGIWWAAAIAGGSAFLISRFVYDGRALIVDAQSQVLQARMLLDGLWSIPMSQQLRDVILFPNGTPGVPLLSQYPPGHILLLVPFMAMGFSPTLLNVLAGAGTAALVVALSRQFGGRKAGVVALLLLAGSPFFLGISGGAMNHGTAAFALTGAAFCFFRAARTGPAGPLLPLALAGGLGLGWACITRPLTGAAHLGVWTAVWILFFFRAWKGRKPVTRLPVRPLLRIGGGAGAALAFCGLLLLFYNWKTTGNPLELGYQKARPQLHQLGFSDAGLYPHSFGRAVDHLAADLLSLNWIMYGWPIGSWVALLVWWVHTRLRGPELVIIALCLAQAGVYALYHFHQLFLGPRFLYELLPLVTVLAACGIAKGLQPWGRRAAAWVGVIAVLTLCAFVLSAAHWRKTFPVLHHQTLDRFMKAHAPYQTPTVVVVSRLDFEGAIALWFSPGTRTPPLFFVEEKDENRARGLAELKGFRWLRLRE